MLTTASQVTLRAGSLHTQHAATERALGARAAHGIGRRHQIRGFRWGVWSSLNEDFAQEIRRRHRMVNRKYSEQLKRALILEKHKSADDSQHALKRIIKSYWHNSYPGGRFCDNAESTKREPPGSKHGARPGQDFDTVERGAMGHQIFDKVDDLASQSSCENQTSKWQMTRKLRSTSSTNFSQPIEQDEFIIDPITNRKITKKRTSSSPDKGEDIPVKTFKDYRSQFGNPDSVSKHAGLFSQPSLHGNDHVQHPGSRETRHNHLKVSNLEEDGSATSEETSKADPSTEGASRYDALLSDQVLDDSGLDANLASSVEGLSKDHDAVLQRRAAIEEAHGNFGDLQPPQEEIEDCRYKSVVADEIASRLKDAECRDVDRINSTSSETGKVGNAEPSCDDVVQDASLQHEGKPLGFREAFVAPEVLHRYQSFIQTVRPGDFPDSTIQKLREKYGATELKQYTAVRPFTLSESSDLTDEVDQRYGGHSTRDEPAILDGPPGKSPLSSEEPRERYDTGKLARYATYCDAHEYDGPQQSATKKGGNNSMAGPETLDRLTSVKQGHGRKLRSPQDWPSGVLEDGVVSDSEAPEQPVASLRPSLERLASVKQGQGKKSNYREMLESLMNQHEQISDVHDQEANLAVKSAKARNKQDYSPKRKFTGNYVRDFPEEFEKSWAQTLRSIPAEAETSYEIQAPTESENMEGGLEGAYGIPTPSRIQPALDRHGSANAVIDQGSGTTNERKGFRPLGDDGHSGVTKRSDSVSGASDELHTNISKEEKTAPTENEAGQYAAEESSKCSEEKRLTSENEPILYKVLAYDPIMQKINVAGTTSLVPDFTPALSPADALLRLSQPTKFFPYFASLEAEGFEIASGSGDVLVFRKVRPSKPEQVKEDSPTEIAVAASKPPVSEMPVNPIDMTGRPRVVPPASANFASPTGYVKYDNLPETEASNLPPPPPPRVAYNINLRREEPVYSGPKYRANSEQRHKKSLGQRLLVGGVWVAGISYGLGVVSEYFTTGGIDGTGPQGL